MCIGAVYIGFDEPRDGEAVRGVIEGDRDMLAREWSHCWNLQEGRGVGLSGPIAQRRA